MTDRTISFLVTLDKDYRTDDAEFIINAIKMIKGVLNVECNIFSLEDDMKRQAIKNQLKKKIYENIFPILDKL